MTQPWADVWKLRTSLYNFLGNVLLKPIREESKEIITSSFWHNFPITAANQQIKSGLKKLISCTSELDRIGIEISLEKVLIEYTKLFIGPGAPKAPPIESFYRSDKWEFFGETTYEMKNIFNKHGVESITKDRRPEDHLGLQLLFISMLTEKLFTLEEEKHMEIISEQISFIGKHIISWIPDLYTDAKEHGTINFYSGLIELIWGVTLWDKKLLEEFVNTHEYVS